MADTHYRLIGEPKIPEDKREEVNQAVLRILHYCGIRKEKKVQAGTGEFTVVEKPVPDADGMITFDYSIYENRMYEPCTYDTKTCAINVKKCGLSEYGLVINMLYTLLESYGNGSCYFVADRHLSNVSAYMAMTSTVLGRKLINTARGNVFDVIHFTADHPDCDMVSSDQLLDDDIFDYTDVDQVQLCQSIISEIQSDSKAKKKKICIEKSRIRQARIELRTNYMYQTLHELYQKNKEELWQYLKVQGLVNDYRQILAVVEEQQKGCTMQEFIKVLADLDAYYKDIMPFDSMFYDFIANLNQMEYTAAVNLLRKTGNDPKNKEAGKLIRYEKQGCRYNRNVIHNIGREHIRRLLSVMANKKLRFRYFEF